MKRDLISLHDFSNEEMFDLIELTAKLKADRDYLNNQLHRKNIGLLFQKPSNRTRTSFEVGIYQLGGNCVYLSPKEINLGVRETVEDVSKTLSRYLDALVARVYKNEDIVDMARHATVPVINGLCDLFHPCQGLTDIFSIYEKFGKTQGLTLAYIGDGNNVCHSLMLAATKVGMNINVATPQGYEPNTDVIQMAMQYAQETNAHISISNDPKHAVTNANAIYADVWVSMGQEEEDEKRRKDFDGFQINRELTELADKNHIFLHCLPAHRGLEVTADVIDGKHSIVFDQAENRLHAQKAIMILLIRTNKEHP